MNMRYAKRSEDTEQINVVSWAGWNMNRYPELKWLFHVPNGGSRNKQEAVKFKQMGVKAGVSDLCLPYPKRRMSNMTDWKKVTGTQPERPEEIDRTSSPSTVYLRKNIEQVEKEVEGADGKMQTVTEWQYDEKEMAVEEYENMALMKSVVEENTSGIVESVTQFQKDAVIDEYTAQLIEEGLI